MYIHVSEFSCSYTNDIVADNGEIIVTFTANIKNNWAVSTCMMNKTMFDENLEYCKSKYDEFLVIAKEKANQNGVVVF